MTTECRPGWGYHGDFDRFRFLHSQIKHFRIIPHLNPGSWLTFSRTGAVDAATQICVTRHVQYQHQFGCRVPWSKVSG